MTSASNRQALARIEFLERQAIKTGEWPPFQTQPAPPQLATERDWFPKVERIHSNGFINVMERTVRTAIGPVIHLAMRRHSGTEMPWSMKYRVFREIIGDRDRMAVEVFPAADFLAEQRSDFAHLWALPAGQMLPFGLRGEGEE